jgi:peptidoglycan/LPS O-acetylase OafA/YrhL
VLLLPAFIFPLETTGWIPVLGVVVFYLGSGALLIGLLHVGVPDIWTCRMAARLGTYSYSIYLWHMPVHVWVVPNVMKMLPAPYQYSWFVYLSVYLIGSFSLGIVLCKLIETPALLLRDKWFPSRAEAAGLRATPRSQSVPNFQVADRSNPLMTPPTG